MVRVRVIFPLSFVIKINCQFTNHSRYNLLILEVFQIDKNILFYYIKTVSILSVKYLLCEKRCAKRERYILKKYIQKKKHAVLKWTFI